MALLKQRIFEQLRNISKIILIALLSMYSIYWQDPGSVVVAAEQLEDDYRQIQNTPPCDIDGAAHIVIIPGKDHYIVGERITVSIQNRFCETIIAPGLPSACSIVSVQQMQEGVWKEKGSCTSLSQVRPLELRPGKFIKGVLDPESRTFWTMGPFTGRSSPLAQEPDPRIKQPSLPKISPNSQIKIPSEGIRSVGAPDPLFHNLVRNLDPGIYRLVFRFICREIPESASAVFSRQFEIVEGTDALKW
jgi:hypothetical protein